MLNACFAEHFAAARQTRTPYAESHGIGGAPAPPDDGHRTRNDHDWPVGAPNSPPSHSDADTRPSANRDSGPYEKWLVRILVTLAFGLAFGIEGMTLVRSFLLDTEPDEQVERREQDPGPTLQERPLLISPADSTIRVHRLRLLASDEAWTFTLVARPVAPLEQPYTLTIDRLTTDAGKRLTTAPSKTWAPGDTAAFRASWSLPPGQRPATLAVTGTATVGPDSTTSSRRTVPVGRVPVRMQRN